MYRTTTNCTTGVSLSEMLLKRKIRTTLDTPLYDRSKWHGPESLWPRCREKKRNREIPWIIKGKEIDIAEGDKVLLNKQRCKKQADTVVINWSDSVRSCVHKKETGVTVQENDACYKCNVTHVKKDREPISVNKVCEPNDVYVESSKSDARCVSYIAPC